MPNHYENTDQIINIERKIAAEKGISVDTLRRLVKTVEQYAESHRPFGMLEELYRILQDELIDEEEK